MSGKSAISTEPRTSKSVIVSRKQHRLINHAVNENDQNPKYCLCVLIGAEAD